MRPLRVLIWHVHGAYLYYLTQSRHTFYLPSRPGRNGDTVGRWGDIPWGANVIDVPADEVKRLELDCVIYQLPSQYLEDRYTMLSAAQRGLPSIYLQHDPPLDHPVSQRHWADDPSMLLVHVTAFNALMWDSGRTPTRVIDHGVLVPEGVRWTGELERGVTAINHLARRGRRLGADVFARARAEVPLDLVGMAADETPGGLYEVRHDRMPEFESHYRFFFNPIRWTSLGLAVCEAMMVGLPVLGLATTEMVTAVKNGVNGFVETDERALVAHMKRLLRDRGEAERLSEGARRFARERFGIERFVRDWERALADVTATRPSPRSVALAGGRR